MNQTSAGKVNHILFGMLMSLLLLFEALTRQNVSKIVLLLFSWNNQLIGECEILQTASEEDVIWLLDT